MILALPHATVTDALARARHGAPSLGAADLALRPGDRVVFTGDMGEPREVWSQRAREHGFVPHPSVTKQVRLLVAADVDSLSGKAKKARGYGIPIMSVDEFRTALGYAVPEGLRHTRVREPVM